MNKKLHFSDVLPPLQFPDLKVDYPLAPQNGTARSTAPVLALLCSVACKVR